MIYSGTNWGGDVLSDYMSGAALADPAVADETLSQQAGNTATCPGPVMFPMASGAEADKWTQDFGYPLEEDTGDISIGGLMDELAEQDEAGKFMLEVYDEIVRLKGGEGSESAAAFLTNFMPPMPGVGDERRHYCKLVYADEVEYSRTSMMGHTARSIDVRRDGELVSSTDPMFNLLGNEILVFVSPKQTTSSVAALYSRTRTTTMTSAEAARAVIREVELNNEIKPWVDWLVFGANVLLIFVGVGATIGALRVVTTVGARLLLTTALVFEVADGTEYITGFIGGKKEGYNPLKAAFRNVGASANRASGAQTAEYIYNTLNIGVGFGGKIGLFAGSLYAITQMPTACQPIEGEATEQPLPSQGGAQQSVL